jgi:hypothetical protein
MIFSYVIYALRLVRRGGSDGKPCPPERRGVFV